MKKAILAGLVLTTSLSAFANTVVQCDEAGPNKYGTHERYEIEINEKNQAVVIDEINWNDTKNSKEGGGTLGYYDKKPLNPKTTQNALVYTFKFQDEGDVDFPGAKTKVTVTLSKSLVGPATVTATYNNGDSGVDSFELSCKVK